MAAPESKANTFAAADPGGILAHLVQEGKDALGRGDLDLALERFAAVVRMHPDRPEGHNNLGALYTSLGRLGEAEESFSQVLEILPDNGNVRYNRGVVRIQRGNYAGAAADLDKVLQVDPEDADSWNNLGVATYLQGDHDAAAAHFNRALQICPTFPNALLNLCDLAAARGQTHTAISHCQDYLRQREDREVRARLLDLLAAESRRLLQEARAVAKILLTHDPEDAALRDRLISLTKAEQAIDMAAAQPA